jgi:hypothetical protein
VARIVFEEVDAELGNTKHLLFTTITETLTFFMRTFSLLIALLMIVIAGGKIRRKTNVNQKQAQSVTDLTLD